MVSGGAEIQPNNNWAKVHNSILELLASTNFTARELRCLLYLLRMTYGERCKEQAISLNEWTTGTNMRRPHIVSTLQSLVSRNVIIKTETGVRSAPIWSFNKYFEQWQPSTPVGTFTGIPKGTSDSTPVGTSDSTLMGTKGSTPVLSISQPLIEREEREQKDIPLAAPASGSRNGDYFGMSMPVRKEKQLADGYTQDAAKAGVNAETYRGIIDALLDAAGLRALVEDGGDDASLNYAKRDALSIIRMGVVTVDMARAAIEACKAANNWREDYQPRSSDIAKYVSQLKQKGKPLPAAPSPTTNGTLHDFDYSALVGG